MTLNLNRRQNDWNHRSSWTWRILIWIKSGQFWKSIICLSKIQSWLSKCSLQHAHHRTIAIRNKRGSSLHKRISAVFLVSLAPLLMSKCLTKRDVPTYSLMTSLVLMRHSNTSVDSIFHSTMSCWRSNGYQTKNTTTNRANSRFKMWNQLLNRNESEVEKWVSISRASNHLSQELRVHP